MSNTSILTTLTENLRKKKYETERGLQLEYDPDYVKLIEMVQEAYLTGYINGVKKYAVFRNGQKVVGPFEIPLNDIIAEKEQEFGIKYKDYFERRKNLN